MNKIKVESFISFMKEIDVFDLIADHVVFRGQPVQGNLLPFLVRDNPTLDSEKNERHILEQLKLQGAAMLPAIEPTNLDLLVLAQHFGLKTRLLDWTSNPLAALWFACSAKAEGDVYVYALTADNLLAKDVYKVDPFLVKKTKVFQPRLNNARIVAQQGWFTLHKYSVKHQKFVPLERNPEISKHLTEYHIPSKRRQELLFALDRCGISAKTIYPDLGGLCQYLNWKH